MIHLTRERTKAAITPGFRGKRRLDKQQKLVMGFADGSIDTKGSKFYNPGYWKKVKPQIREETHGKCAYCEAPAKAVTHADVEHYRPKSVYWWLAYTYDNYLYSCQLCNQTFKGDHFPTAGPGMRAPRIPPNPSKSAARRIGQFMNPDPLNDDEGMPRKKFEKAAAAEKAWIIDPYQTDPEKFYKWVADPVLKEVSLQPRTRHAWRIRAFQAARDLLGLNREQLLEARWKLSYRHLRRYRTFYKKGVEYNDADLINEASLGLAECLADDAPFAGMARYFVRDKWKINLA